MITSLPISVAVLTTVLFIQEAPQAWARSNNNHQITRRHTVTTSSHPARPHPDPAPLKNRGISLGITTGITSGLTVASSTGSKSAKSNSNTTKYTSGSSTGTAYTLSLDSSGSTFFDDWDFFSHADPTNGMVNYQTAAQAWQEGLVSVGPSPSDSSLTTAIMKVDNSTILSDGEHRKSVRLSSKKSFKYGLLVLDVIKMPFGCSTWPAFWTVGDNWPSRGEIDIVEGVNMLTTNQMTLHTGPGCNVQRPMSGFATGNVLNTNCDVASSSNAGCGVADSSASSYGEPFNANGGGVFAMEWKASGISVWRFSRGSIPEDLTSGIIPDPSTWSTKPAAHWSNDDCPNLSENFGEHKIIFDITLCGDWAGTASVYNANNACSGSCASAIKDPSNFNDAQWEIASVKLYQ